MLFRKGHKELLKAFPVAGACLCFSKKETNRAHFSRLRYFLVREKKNVRFVVLRRLLGCIQFQNEICSIHVLSHALFGT